MPHSFQVDGVRIGGDAMFLIAGPCVIESEEHALKMAECVAGVCRALHLPVIFKASYDKANRTSLRSYRGPGLRDGLRILRKIKDTVRIPILTDVHEASDVARVADAVDVIQVPAFLSRQTDLLLAAAASKRAVNIKKGQFAAPWDMRHAVAKVRDAGNDRVFLTERGTTFGYNNLVVDMRGLAVMREFAPVVFDATHSVQLPSAGGASAKTRETPAQLKLDRRSRSSRRAHEQHGSNGAVQSGGQPEYIPLLARAAVAAGVDGVFMEVHDNPAHALSDGANALDLRNLRELLRQLMAIRAAVARPPAAKSRAN
jgi:2-dehydro-3-deoxyphosphooctonate aldolase (KDO 8-P synthase)